MSSAAVVIGALRVKDADRITNSVTPGQSDLGLHCFALTYQSQYYIPILKNFYISIFLGVKVMAQAIGQTLNILFWETQFAQILSKYSVVTMAWAFDSMFAFLCKKKKKKNPS